MKKKAKFFFSIVTILIFSFNLLAMNFGIKTNLNSSSTSNFIMGMVYHCYALNVRKSPWGKILDVIYRGDIVKIIGNSVDNRWYKIEFNQNGIPVAYVSKRYITFNPNSTNTSINNNPKIKPTRTIQTGYVTASTLNVRKNPWGLILGKLPYEHSVTITGRDGNWYKISYQGITAFVYAKYIKLGSPSRPNSNDKNGKTTVASGNQKLGRKLVDIARSYIGSTQFRTKDVAYGRLACAKFVSTVLHDAGVINVVLNVRALVKALKQAGWVEVSPPPWQDGDIVTWKTYDYTGDGIKDPDTHVGVVDVKGNGVYAIHNSSSRRYPRETAVNWGAPISRVLRPPKAV